MKTPSSVIVYFLFICGDAFLFPTLPFRPRNVLKSSGSAKQPSDLLPHPPDVPPPEDLLEVDDKIRFLTQDYTSADVRESESVHSDSTGGNPLVDIQLQEELARKLLNELVVS